MYVRMYLQKDKDIFFKDQELSQKDHSLCKKLQDFFEKVGRVFRKLQSLFERYTTAFYNSTQFPYIFHQPWIGFILDFNLSLNRKNTCKTGESVCGYKKEGGCYECFDR